MEAKDLPVPVGHRYFEDYVPGTVGVLGPVEVTAEEIVEFARRYDPQPIHVDAEAAARGPFGGLIASGWHTIALVMRVLVEHYLSPVAAIVSPGIDELRWKAPVRPGDVLSVRVTVLEAAVSRTKPDRGLVRTHVEAINQRGEVAMSFRAMNFMLRREPGNRVPARE